MAFEERTHERVVQMAQSIASVSRLTSQVLTEITKVLTQNSDLSIDWGAALGSTPNYINEVQGTEGDPGVGNLEGLPFTRQSVSNAIGSLDQVRALLAGEVSGDHLGNLNKLINPEAIRVRTGN